MSATPPPLAASSSGPSAESGTASGSHRLDTVAMPPLGEMRQSFPCTPASASVVKSPVVFPPTTPLSSPNPLPPAGPSKNDGSTRGSSPAPSSSSSSSALLEVPLAAPLPQAATRRRQHNSYAKVVPSPQIAARASNKDPSTSLRLHNLNGRSPTASSPAERALSPPSPAPGSAPVGPVDKRRRLGRSRDGSPSSRPYTASSSLTKKGVANMNDRLRAMYGLRSLMAEPPHEQKPDAGPGTAACGSLDSPTRAVMHPPSCHSPTRTAPRSSAATGSLSSSASAEDNLSSTSSHSTSRSSSSSSSERSSSRAYGAVEEMEGDDALPPPPDDALGPLAYHHYAIHRLISLGFHVEWSVFGLQEGSSTAAEAQRAKEAGNGVASTASLRGSAVSRGPQWSDAGVSPRPCYAASDGGSGGSRGSSLSPRADGRQPSKKVASKALKSKKKMKGSPKAEDTASTPVRRELWKERLSGVARSAKQCPICCLYPPAPSKRSARHGRHQNSSSSHRPARSPAQRRRHGLLPAYRSIAPPTRRSRPSAAVCRTDWGGGVTVRMQCVPLSDAAAAAVAELRRQNAAAGGRAAAAGRGPGQEAAGGRAAMSAAPPDDRTPFARRCWRSYRSWVQAQTADARTVPATVPPNTLSGRTPVQCYLPHFSDRCQFYASQMGLHDGIETFRLTAFLPPLVDPASAEAQPGVGRAYASQPLPKPLATPSSNPHRHRLSVAPLAFHQLPSWRHVKEVTNYSEGRRFLEAAAGQEPPIPPGVRVFRFIKEAPLTAELRQKLLQTTISRAELHRAKVELLGDGVKPPPVISPSVLGGVNACAVYLVLEPTPTPQVVGPSPAAGVVDDAYFRSGSRLTVWGFTTYTKPASARAASSVGRTSTSASLTSSSTEAPMTVKLKRGSTGTVPGALGASAQSILHKKMKARGGGEGDAAAPRPQQHSVSFYISQSLEDYFRLAAAFGWIYGWQLCYAPCGPPASSVPWLRLFNPSAFQITAKLRGRSRSGSSTRSTSHASISSVGTAPGVSAPSRGAPSKAIGGGGKPNPKSPPRPAPKSKGSPSTSMAHGVPPMKEPKALANCWF